MLIIILIINNILPLKSSHNTTSSLCPTPPRNFTCTSPSCLPFAENSYASFFNRHSLAHGVLECKLKFDLCANPTSSS